MSAEPAKSVHPFFTRPKAHAQLNANDNDFAAYPPQDAAAEPYDDHGKPEEKSGRIAKKDDQQLTKTKTQSTLGEIVNPKAPEGLQQDVEGLCTSEPDLNSGRRKRRRTGEHASLDVGSESDIKNETLDLEPSTHQRGSSPQVLIPTSSPFPQAGSAQDQIVTSDSAVTAPRTPPKKVLRLNANGKFSSPPSKKPKVPIVSEAEAEPRSRRGRPRTSAKPTKETRLLVKCSYGNDYSSRRALGEKIDRILNSKESIQITTQTTPPKKVETTPRKKTPQKPAKVLHPFFEGKPKEQPVAIQMKQSPRKTSAVTPGKLRMQTLSDQLHNTKEVPFSSALLKDRLIIKHPGAKDPHFPAKEQVHIRGLTFHDIPPKYDFNSTGNTIRRRKCKRANISLPGSESVLSHFAAHLTPEENTQLRDDGFYEPDNSLHIPGRLLLPGEEIAKMVANELSIAIPDSGDDELAFFHEKSPHPALRGLYDRIPAIMTAYDECKGEMLPWAQKHAPTSSDVVLQPASAMKVLRDWLKSLAVQTVIGAAAIPEKPAHSKATDKSKKKRKKKADDLDDFLVHSDEESHDMSELPEDGSPVSAKTAQKSIVQIVQNGTKLSNVLLLSGPHGCGKTAAAYAVAKELDFKIFEISSSERRSGRDVLDKVGDMTENHLVKHHGSEDVAASSSSEENGRLDDAFQKDLVSGKQGKMNAFFRPQAKSKMPQPKKIIKEMKMKAVQEALKKPPKDQQQSLILLEEVDILFREDKEFWSTVLKLITTSKRPFIMTCNDEDLVPLQAMNLHAILRFSQPPVDLATDYMLLMAAAEGHFLKRKDVMSLYEHHAHDLRASIAKLDYWCQMGIGDPRGGLAWIYQRWPPGSDVDEKGRKLRVVSNGTFQDGMGMLTTSADAEDAIFWLGREFGVTPSAALGWDEMQETTVRLANPKNDARRGQDILRQYAKFADSLSAADTCTANGHSGTVQLDTTQPELPEKARAHYIEGMALLQTDEAVDYSAMNERLLLAQLVTTSRAYREFGLREEPDFNSMTTRSLHRGEDEPLSRAAFACFDAIATPSEVSTLHPCMLQSAFDGAFRTVTLDLAPYVRSIVQYDQALEEQRERIDLLTLNGGGRRGKRARTTRAARSALEGGQRASTRRERWFDISLDDRAVLATGGTDWPRFINTPASLDGVSKDGTDGTEGLVSSAEDDEIKFE